MASMSVTVPVEALACVECRARFMREHNEVATLYQRFSVNVGDSEREEPLTLTFEVNRIRWQRKAKGIYAAEATAILLCPACETRHEYRAELAAPGLLLRSLGACRDCHDGELELQDEVIEYSTAADDGGKLLVVSGRLVCSRCHKELNGRASVVAPQLIEQLLLGEEIVVEMSPAGDPVSGGLERMERTETAKGATPFSIMNREANAPLLVISQHTVINMDTYNVEQSAVVGPNARASGITLHQLHYDVEGLNLAELAIALETLQEAMRRQSSDAEADEAIKSVATAQKAARDGDGSKAMEYLRAAGRRALDVAEEVGVSIAVEALRRALGLI